MQTRLFIPKLIGATCIRSRTGLCEDALPFAPDFDFFAHISEHRSQVSCIMIDEAQFLKKEQVLQLAKVADVLQIPVLCYGLRSDFLGEPFEGSKYLLCQADILSEIKTICWCGRKATMNQRVGADGEALLEGAQVEVGGNEKYVGKCRKHFHQSLEAAAVRAEATVTPREQAADDASRALVETPEKGDDPRGAVQPKFEPSKRPRETLAQVCELPITGGA